MINKRNLAGMLLLLVLVGEPTVGFANGLYTPTGLIVLLALYFSFFLLLDSLVDRLNLNNLGLVLITFSLYAVFITGLLHGEIKDYVLHPENRLITTLIRIQASFFTIFAFHLLRKWRQNKTAALSVSKSLAIFLGYILLLSASGNFGLKQVVSTFQVAPSLAIIFSVLATFSLVVGLRQKASLGNYNSRGFMGWSICLLLVALIPHIGALLTLIVLTICTSWFYLAKPDFRKAKI